MQLTTAFWTLILATAKSIGKITFDKQLFQFSLDENAKSGSVVGTLRSSLFGASDKVLYRLGSDAAGKFDVISENGTILSRTVFDYEKILDPMLFTAYAYTTVGDEATAHVVVIINNLNDNDPKFTQLVYRASVIETKAVSDFVIRVEATDEDNGVLLYAIVSSSQDSTFKVDAYSGQVLVDAPLDYEARQFYNLTISVTDGLPGDVNRKFAYATLLIDIRDADDNGAQFEKAKYSASVFEGIYLKTVFLRLNASDGDKSLPSSIIYSVDGDSEPASGLFHVNASTGEMFINGTIDRESVSMYHIRVLASSGPHASGVALVTVHVLDVNDNAPTFRLPSYNGTVMENSPAGSVIFTVQANDLDEGDYGKLKFFIPDPSIPFTIDDEGTIRVNGSIDREIKDIYTFEVQVHEAVTIEKRSASTEVTIQVLDANDNSPEFARAEFFTSIVENQSPGTLVIKFSARDRDVGSNSELLYSIEADVSGQYVDFRINPATGEVTTAKSLDRESRAMYSLLISASDRAVAQSRKTTVVLFITVLDENDNQPLFEKGQYYVEVVEAVSPNTVVATLKASDADTGSDAQLSFALHSSIPANAFYVNSSSGILRTSAVLDRETIDEYELTAMVSDTGGKSSICKVTVKVLDINDNSPAFDSSSGYNFAVEEGLHDAMVGQVHATDRDVGPAGDVYYTLHGSERFYIDNATGRIFTKERLDRELLKVHSLSVVASDRSPDSRSSQTQVTVMVLDINDNGPRFDEPKSFYSMLDSASKVGTSIYRFRATDADEGKFAAMIFKSKTALPAYMELRADTGELLLASAIPAGVQNISIAVLVVSVELPYIHDEATLTVSINKDKLDAPRFMDTEMTLDIFENSTPGMVIDLNATYGGLPETELFEYELFNSDASFRIDRRTGVVWAMTLDRETASQYSLIVVVRLQGHSASNFMSLVIRVLDINDNPPKFENASLTVLVQENTGLGADVFISTCTDRDVGLNAVIRYSIEGTMMLSIDEVTGRLFVSALLDRESRENVRFTIKCENSKVSPALSSSQEVTVHVSDVNDNAPQFPISPVFVNVTENNDAGQMLTSVMASDLDSGKNGEVRYAIRSVQPECDCFSIGWRDGGLVSSRSLDREMQSIYKLDVVALDSGTPQLSTSIFVYVNVLDVNDNRPMFEMKNYRFSVPEDSEVGSLVGRVKASDADDDSICKYCVIHTGNDDDTFLLVMSSGSIVLSKRVDRELKATYKLLIRVYDEPNEESPVTFDESEVEIFLSDVNDNKPKFEKIKHVAGVRHDSPYATNVLQLRAVDADVGSSSALSFVIAAGSLGSFYTLQASSGMVLVSETLIGLEGSSVYFTLVVRDNAGEPPYLESDERASVKIIVFGSDSIGVLWFSGSSDYLHRNIFDLERLLSNLTGGVAHVDRVFPTPAISSTLIHFHVVDEIHERVMSQTEIARMFQIERTPVLESWRSFWNISLSAPTTKAPTSSQQAGSDDEEVYIAVIIAVSCCVLLLAVLVLCFWFRDRKRRKSEESGTQGLPCKLPLDDDHRSTINSSQSCRYIAEPYEVNELYESVRSSTKELEHRARVNIFYSSDNMCNGGRSNSDKSTGDKSSVTASYYSTAATLRVPQGIRVTPQEAKWNCTEEEEDEIESIVESIDVILADKLAGLDHDNSPMVTVL